MLRMACSTPLLIMGSTQWSGWPADSMYWARLLSGLAAAFILAGLWTPLAAACQAILQGLLAWSGAAFLSADLTTAWVAASLLMLGPGAWSVDARLYGRKRIDLGGG